MGARVFQACLQAANLEINKSRLPCEGNPWIATKSQRVWCLLGLRGAEPSPDCLPQPCPCTSTHRRVTQHRHRANLGLWLCLSWLCLSLAEKRGQKQRSSSRAVRRGGRDGAGEAAGGFSGAGMLLEPNPSSPSLPPMCLESKAGDLPQRGPESLRPDPRSQPAPRTS